MENKTHVKKGGRSRDDFKRITFWLYEAHKAKTAETTTWMLTMRLTVFMVDLSVTNMPLVNIFVALSKLLTRM